MTDRARLAIVTAVLFVSLAIVIWLVVTDAPVVRWMIRLYQDKHFLKETVRSWGMMAPLVFMAIQALQVIISPIPGEITGPVGGALFGVWWGIVYSTIGLTLGTLFCFWVGRRGGEPLLRPWPRCVALGLKPTSNDDVSGAGKTAGCAASVTTVSGQTGSLRSAHGVAEAMVSGSGSPAIPI